MILHQISNFNATDNAHELLGSPTRAPIVEAIYWCGAHSWDQNTTYRVGDRVTRRRVIGVFGSQFVARRPSVTKATLYLNFVFVVMTLELLPIRYPLNKSAYFSLGTYDITEKFFRVYIWKIFLEKNFF